MIELEINSDELIGLVKNNHCKQEIANNYFIKLVENESNFLVFQILDDEYYAGDIVELDIQRYIVNFKNIDDEEFKSLSSAIDRVKEEI